MAPIPPVRPLDASGLPDGGHLWIHELVTGGWLSFRMTATGVLEFDGTDEGPFESAILHVRSRFDRDALFDAVDAVTAYRFFGIAPWFAGVDYDWDRLTPFFGVEIWPADGTRPLPPDVVEKIYPALGLDPLAAIEKEVRAGDYRPTFPESRWADDRAYGVLIRDKTGDRATVTRSDVHPPAAMDPTELSPEIWVERFFTVDRIERAAGHLREAGQPMTVDPLRERVVVLLDRETALDPSVPTDPDEARLFRTAAAERIVAWLEGASA